MNDRDRLRIMEYRREGMGYTRIASLLGLPQNAVKAYLQKSGKEIPQVPTCPECGAVLVRQPHRKVKMFCSDKCRMAWWNHHLDCVERKTYRTFTCAFCGKSFESYGSRERRYCSRQCYAEARRKEMRNG